MMQASYTRYFVVSFFMSFIVVDATTSSVTRVWDVISSTDVVAQSFESKVCVLEDTALPDIDGTFTTIATIESKACNVQNILNSTMSFLDSIIDATFTLDSTVDAVDIVLSTISSQIATIQVNDFGGTWTIIETSQTNACDRFTTIINNLNAIDMAVDIISGDQLDAFLGTCTMIASISDVVAQNMELICDIAATLGSDTNTIDSYIDIILDTAATLESKIDILNPEIEQGFTGTFTALDALESKLCAVDNAIDGIDAEIVIFTDLETINAKLETASSNIDRVESDLASVCDSLQTVESLLDTLSSLVDIIDSDVDIISVQQDTVLASVQTVIADLTTIESKLDSILLLDITTESKLCSIENAIDNTLLNSVITADSTVDVVQNSILTIVSSVDVLDTTAKAIFSNVCTAESNVDTIDRVLLTVESQVDLFVVLEVDVSTVNSLIDVAIEKSLTLESSIDTLDAQALASLATSQTIQSNLDTLLVQVCTVESLLDNADALVVTVDSKIATIDAALGTIDSKVCALEIRIDASDIALNTVQNSLTQISTNLDELGADFIETWTILDALVDKVISVNVGADTIDSKVDVVDNTVAGDLSETFTALAGLEVAFLTVESAVDSINLIAPDIIGTFSLIEEMLQKSCTMVSRLEDVESTIIDFSRASCLGTGISSSDIGTTGYTISESGRYFLTEFISFAPSPAAPAITIDADNVELDLCGYSIDQTNGTTGVNAILVNGVSNVKIMNGNVFTIVGNQIEVSSGASDILIEKMIVAQASGASSSGIYFSGTVNNVVIRNCMINNNGRDGITMEAGSNYTFDSLMINENVRDGIHIDPGTENLSNIYIYDCVFDLNDNGIIIDGTGGERTGIVIDKCLMFDNTVDGINLSNVKNSVVKNCTLQENDVYGIQLVGAVSGVEIYNNIITTHLSAGIQIADSSAESCSIQNNIITLNGTYNYREEANAGSHSVLGNFALLATEANNYSIGGGTGPTTINKSIIDQSTGTFGTRPGKWRNISMTT